VLSLEGMAETTKESASCTSITTGRRRRVFASSAGLSNSVVASSSCTNMPDAGVLQSPLSGGLAVELLIEGEDGTLAGLVDISCSASSAGEFGGRFWEASLEERRWASCGGAAAGLGSLEGVSSSASARVDVFARVWVRLGDCVLGWHCSLWVE